MARMGRTVITTRVTWQGAVMLLALVFIGATTAISFSVAHDKDQRGADGWFEFYWISLPIALSLCALAVWSRLRPDGVRGRRLAILNRLAMGLALSAFAVVVTMLSYNYGTFPALGEQWWILPSGLYLAGMAVVANAMNPDEDP